MKELSKLYDQLTPTERFRAVLEAVARDDAEEVDKLIDTCPRFNYRMTDRVYAQLTQQGLILTFVFTLAAPELVTRIRILEAIPSAMEIGACLFAYGLLADEKIPLEVEAVEAMEARLSEQSPEPKEYSEQYKERINQAVGQLKGLYSGFERLCAEREMEAETLIKTFTGPWADTFFGMLSRYEDIPPDAEAEEEYFQGLCNQLPAMRA
ncbi:MAG: hypothetical protein ACYCXE_02360 [Thermoleophilia bacterium]